MSNSFNLYKASPEAFFATLDKNLAELTARLDECIARLDGLSGLGEAFLTNDLAGTLGGQPQTAWTYDAALPNKYFADVFAPEHAAPRTKRWVGKTGRIGTRLGLSRSFQYDFIVRVVNFVSPEAETSFTLTVNDEPYPWLETKDGTFRTIILESPEATELAFELAIDPATVPTGKDVTFAFASIAIDRRG